MIFKDDQIPEGFERNVCICLHRDALLNMNNVSLNVGFHNGHHNIKLLYTYTVTYFCCFLPICTPFFISHSVVIVFVTVVRIYDPSQLMSVSDRATFFLSITVCMHCSCAL